MTGKCVNYTRILPCFWSCSAFAVLHAGTPTVLIDSPGAGNSGVTGSLDTHIIQSVRISKRGEAFVQDVCGEFDSWFGDNHSSSWAVVWGLISNRLQLVRFICNVIPLYLCMIRRWSCSMLPKI
jgi:hypothetical protein